MKTPKTFTLLPNETPGFHATINGQRISVPTIATEHDQIGCEFEATHLHIGLGSLDNPLNLDQ